MKEYKIKHQTSPNTVLGESSKVLKIVETDDINEALYEMVEMYCEEFSDDVYPTIDPDEMHPMANCLDYAIKNDQGTIIYNPGDHSIGDKDQWYIVTL